MNAIRVYCIRAGGSSVEKSLIYSNKMIFAEYRIKYLNIRLMVRINKHLVKPVHDDKVYNDELIKE